MDTETTTEWREIPLEELIKLIGVAALRKIEQSVRRPIAARGELRSVARVFEDLNAGRLYYEVVGNDGRHWRLPGPTFLGLLIPANQIKCLVAGRVILVDDVPELPPLVMAIGASVLVLDQNEYPEPLPTDASQQLTIPDEPVSLPDLRQTRRSRPLVSLSTG